MDPRDASASKNDELDWKEDAGAGRRLLVFFHLFLFLLSLKSEFYQVALSWPATSAAMNKKTENI